MAIPDIKVAHPPASARVRALSGGLAPESLVSGRTYDRWRCGRGGRLRTDGSRHPTHEGLERPVDVPVSAGDLLEGGAPDVLYRTALASDRRDSTAFASTGSRSRITVSSARHASSSAMSSRPAWAYRFRVAINSWTQLRASRSSLCRNISFHQRSMSRRDRAASRFPTRAASSPTAGSPWRWLS